MREFDSYPLIAWRAEYGPLPDNYLAVDTETTGLSHEFDFVLQLGWCEVKNRKPVMSVDMPINWPSVLSPAELQQFSARLESTRERMDKKGKAYPWTVEMLRTRGVHPREAVKRFLQASGPDASYVTHYGWQLDYPMIARLVGKYGPGFDVYQDQMYDTGMLVKAGLVSMSPAKGEPQESYLKRLSDIRNCPHHNLGACVDRFKLDQQGASKAKAHDASYDAWLCHLLFEEIRSYIPEEVR